MIAAAADPEDLAWLTPMAERAMAHERVGRFNRVVRAAGLIGTPASVRSLALMRRRCRHATMRGQLEAALGDAATAAGLTIAEAKESAALDHGLDGRQTRREALAAGHVAILRLGGTGRASLGYEAPDGKPLTRLPAAVRDEASSRSTLATLKADAKALAADLAVHRFRLERSWLTGQTWSARGGRPARGAADGSRSAVRDAGHRCGEDSGATTTETMVARRAVRGLIIDPDPRRSG